jgi:hypothetical protein
MGLRQGETAEVLRLPTLRAESRLVKMDTSRA